MPRPRKCRMVGQVPRCRFFKPQGVPMQDLTGVNLPVEGLEAIRLADAQGLEHEQAAEKMGVSRPTFSRILTEARRIVARALTNGWAIHIEGGDFEIAAYGASSWEDDSGCAKRALKRLACKKAAARASGGGSNPEELPVPESRGADS